mmetsp:Transcript_203/g.433  ORF Transcript_203/g.433 Transcript_203/m.433 type:complete len:148 (+) Transcript_203:30-473(+)
MRSGRAPLQHYSYIFVRSSQCLARAPRCNAPHFDRSRACTSSAPQELLQRSVPQRLPIDSKDLIAWKKYLVRWSISSHRHHFVVLYINPYAETSATTVNDDREFVVTMGETIVRTGETIPLGESTLPPCDTILRYTIISSAETASMQ